MKIQFCYISLILLISSFSVLNVSAEEKNTKSVQTRGGFLASILIGYLLGLVRPRRTKAIEEPAEMADPEVLEPIGPDFDHFPRKRAVETRHKNNFLNGYLMGSSRTRGFEDSPLSEPEPEIAG